MKAVYTIVEKAGGKDSSRKFWVRVGTAFENRDGSMNVRLDALPVNGMLHIREAMLPEPKADDPSHGEDG